ncbi:MAG: metallo-mystery pair system four-Cys motif protein [Proteobacteria bacterium]|nr:metallo-mystery pair system four-Cys motif protein [Pseudomonadota bacterium]
MWHDVRGLRLRGRRLRSPGPALLRLRDRADRRRGSARRVHPHRRRRLPGRRRGAAGLRGRFGGGCAGDAGTHDAVAGTVAEGEYTGVAFTLGIPSDLNHQDAFDAEPPFDTTQMFWEWNSGYRFLRVDRAEGSANNWLFHLGSTSCEAQDNGDRVCEHANRTRIELDGFDADASVVTLDLADLVGSTDIDVEPGCQSQTNTPECEPLFRALGLGFDGGDGGTQSAFSLR